jgi:hypothetical protein
MNENFIEMSIINQNEAKGLKMGWYIIKKIDNDGVFLIQT